MLQIATARKQFMVFEQRNIQFGIFHTFVEAHDSMGNGQKFTSTNIVSQLFNISSVNSHSKALSNVFFQNNLRMIVLFARQKKKARDDNLLQVTFL